MKTLKLRKETVEVLEDNLLNALVGGTKIESVDGNTPSVHICITNSCRPECTDVEKPDCNVEQEETKNDYACAVTDDYECQSYFCGETPSVYVCETPGDSIIECIAIDL